MGIFVAITILYGFMMQRDKVISALLSCYMGLVIVNFWSGPIQAFFEGKKTIANTWVQANASPATIKIILFLLIVGLVTAKTDISIGRESSLLAPIETIAYSIITALLISGTILSFLPDGTQQVIFQQTRLIHFLKDYYTVWLILPVIIMIFVSARRKSY